MAKEKTNKQNTIAGVESVGRLSKNIWKVDNSRITIRASGKKEVACCLRFSPPVCMWKIAFESFLEVRMMIKITPWLLL